MAKTSKCAAVEFGGHPQLDCQGKVHLRMVGSIAVNMCDWHYEQYQIGRYTYPKITSEAS